MLITARQAAEILAEEGMSRRGAMRLLASGIAGPGVRTRTVTLYEDDLVRGLLGRLRLRDTDLDAVCPDGVFVARRHLPVRPLDNPQAADAAADAAAVATAGPPAPSTEQLAALREGWRMSIWTLLYVEHLVKERGGLPLIATVRGYIVLGANITGVRVLSSGQQPLTLTFDLAAPGAWYDRLHGYRLEREPGSPWTLRGGTWLGPRTSWQPSW